MSSAAQQLNPRANVFVLVNLGCEMLYVIDQRLKAQEIEQLKAAQVIHEITCVLLDAKFIESLMVGSTHANGKVLSTDLCKFMLRDIALSSVMHLDKFSMEKLWNLMTMIYKWQLFLSKHQHHLMDITFRHLDGVALLYPNENCIALIDRTKNTLLEFWNAATDEQQTAIYHTNKFWLEKFNIKMSLLLRLGFQNTDGDFVQAADVKETYFQEFADCIGENIYVKAAKLAASRREELLQTCYRVNAAQHINELTQLLNVQTNKATNEHCNIIFNNTNKTAVAANNYEFVQLQTVYKRTAL